MRCPTTLELGNTPVKLIIRVMAAKQYHSLAKALTALTSEEEAKRFLRDLLTLSEIDEFEKRFAIAQLLWSTDLSYLEIAKKIGTSTTTVTRVARFLEKEPYKGYQAVLNRLEPK